MGRQFVYEVNVSGEKSARRIATTTLFRRSTLLRAKQAQRDLIGLGVLENHKTRS